MRKFADLDKDMAEILLTEEEIDIATTRLAAEIDRDYKDSKRVLLLGILKGSVVVMGDIMKKLTHQVEIDFMKVSSYCGGTKST